MKLIRYGREGLEKPGLLDSAGGVRDLSAIIADIGPAQLSPEGLARLREIRPEALPAVEGSPRLAAPLTGSSKFVAVGLNYSDHAREAGLPIPPEPILFMKATTALCGPYDDIVLPEGASKTDWEVELGVVVGSVARRVREAEALRYVAGYCVANDVSERVFQLEHGGQWVKGKSCDTFAPLGPWLVTADEVPDPQNLDLWLEVNGERRQASNTRHMIFGVAYLVSYVSRFMTLLPGDVILTGTPSGVGLGMKHPEYLKDGDGVRAGITGLGEQRQKVRSPSA